MYKLFILAALFALTLARPGYLPASPVIYSAPSYYEEPVYASVGAVVKSIPTAVSHQAISQVHSSAHYVEPIVAPVLKTTYNVPAFTSYAATAPIYQNYAAAPVVHHYNAAPLYKSYAPSYATAYSQWHK